MTIARVAGVIRAPPAPMQARAAISSVAPVENAAGTDAAARVASPAMRTRRGP
ncbi:hypothetical protein NE236_06385 [Actinoallomurus purpureus]|nr:hypothetical protein [Actinoallomurus purpureus]MCO6004603.1 hypothetical protein [Actinoallomurus purpureus]